MIVGLLGHAGSGKDTVGSLLVQYHGFYAMAFADAMKVFCHWLFDWSPEQLWGKSEQRDPIVRKALQTLGTEWARAIESDCHVHFMQTRIECILKHGIHYIDPLWPVLPNAVRDERYKLWAPRQDSGVNMVVTDCRFKNEIEGLRNLGGRIHRVVRSTPPIAVAAVTTDTADVADTQWRQHTSETEQNKIADFELDGIIDNNGTLEDLNEKIKGILWEPAYPATITPF